MIHSLHLYTVHTRPSRGDDMPMFVREGFSVWAFLLTGLWALYHRIWRVAAMLLLMNVCIMSLEAHEYINSFSSAALLFMVQLFAGFHGHDWLRSGLARRGWRFEGVVSGESEMRAALRYFTSLQAAGAMVS